MEWNHDIDLSKRKYSSKLIVERALARGWKVCGFKTNPAIFLIYVPGRPEPIKIFSASPAQMSYPAAKIAKDKYITNQILAANGLPVPKELLCEDAKTVQPEKLNKFLEAVKKVVVKPLDSSHGKGITVDVTDGEHLQRALAVAEEAGVNQTVLVQEQIAGFDIRILCINYEFTDAISRIPAHVVGDGTHTVKELIELTNQSDDRGENYKARLNFIPLDKAEAYLGTEQLKTVPTAKQVFQVIGVSNIGMGGERSNLKAQIPEFLKDMACKAAKSLELPVCGVDFMVAKLPEVTSTQEDINPYIIEVNECPMLTLYEDLNSPEQAAVIDQYLDLVAKH